MKNSSQRKTLAIPGGGETVQILGRLGYEPTVAPAPCWPLEAKLHHG